MRNDSPDLQHNLHNRGGSLRKLADFVLSHRKRVMVFWLILFLVGGAFSGQVSKKLSVNWSLPGQPGYETSKKIVNQYGNDSSAGTSLLVLNLQNGHTVEAEKAQIASAFKNMRTQFPTTRIVDYASTGDSIFNTADGKTTYAIMFAPMPTDFSAKPLSKQVETALQTAVPDAKVTATGVNELSTSNDDGGGTGVLAETMIAGLGALAILAWVFASLLALVPVMIAAVAICTTLLIVLGVTYIAPVSFVVQFLVSLVGLGVAIDYSLLIVTRWREELNKGATNDEAIRISMATAGHAVLLSGINVAIGLLALVVLPVPDLRSVGYGGMLIPLVSTAVVLTMLPAMLGGFAKKLNWPQRVHEDKPSRVWTAWAKFIVRRKWIAAISATAVLILLIIPVFNLKIGTSNSDSLAKSGPAYDAFHTLIDNGTPRGVLTPMEILTTKASAQQVQQKLKDVKGINSVVQSSSADSNKGDTTVLLAIPTKEMTDSSSTQPVKDARAAIENIPGVVGISGSGAIQEDYLHAVFGNAPLVFAIIAVLTFILLARAFHSVVLALKALVLNVVSLAAIFGVLTWFWQQGHGSQPIFDVTATGAITFWVPTMVFAFLFGLSMDYEVFILARMREEYDRSGSTEQAIIVGIGRTGRLVTSAALILFMSFASLALAGFTDLKVLATGLGAGILLDATIVRAFLLPALVALFGEANWWMPKSLATILRTELPAKAPKSEVVPTT
jgi:putative drug exporter of the RND superfamily